MSDDGQQTTIEDPVITIGVLARKVDLSVSAVRKYETEGLIIAHRTESGHRMFSQEDIERVRYIQHLIQDLGMNIEGIRRMQALLPCWELMPCSSKSYETCPAYSDNTRPCWTIKGLDCAPQGNECRRCPVYRCGSLCTEHIKELMHNQVGSSNVNEYTKELMDRRRRFRKEKEE